MLILILCALVIASCSSDDGTGPVGGSGHAAGGVGGAPTLRPCSEGCRSGEICDRFLADPVCVSLRCNVDDDRCPTAYDCFDIFGDDCDPSAGDQGCPGECICGDGCEPDECETDQDCDFGEYCRGELPTQCWSFPCGTDSEFVFGADCSPPDAGIDEFIGGPPAGALCVDNPRTDCEFGADPTCTGLCVPPPCSTEFELRCVGTESQQCLEGVWQTVERCDQSAEYCDEAVGRCASDVSEARML